MKRPGGAAAAIALLLAILHGQNEEYANELIDFEEDADEPLV